MFKNFSIYLLTALMLVVPAAICAAIPSPPSPPRLVNDFAGVFTPRQAGYLENVLTAFDDSTSNQITVVTVNDLEGYTASEYATRIGLDWKVGSEKFDNGVVLLIKPKTQDSGGQVAISVGYGLEGALPDSKTGRIIDTYGLDYLKNDNFSAGLLEISKSVINEVYIEYGIAPEDGYTEIEDNETAGAGNIAASWAALLAFVAIYVLVFGRRGFGKISNIEDIDIIITDSGIPSSMKEQIEEAGVQIIVAE